MAEAKQVKSSKPKAESKSQYVKADKAAVESVVEKVKTPTTTEAKKPLAKAGKRSSKAVKETEGKAAKVSRKIAAKTEEKTKFEKNPPRSRVERAGKKYREVAKQIDKTQSFDLKAAVELAIKSSPVKFDATVELHINLNVDPKQADQNLRGVISLPAGTGKTLKVATLSSPADAEKLFTQLDKGEVSFDILISTPEMMPQLGKYARVLGPKGLMPNPKSGTVTKDVEKAAEEAKKGKVEYRVDSNGIVHLGIGKVSFGADKILQNAEVVMSSIRSAKPASIKGQLIESAYITTSMGPSIRISL